MPGADVMTKLSADADIYSARVIAL
jgi:hypothetical protein